MLSQAPVKQDPEKLNLKGDKIFFKNIEESIISKYFWNIFKNDTSPKKAILSRTVLSPTIKLCSFGKDKNKIVRIVLLWIFKEIRFCKFLQIFPKSTKSRPNPGNILFPLYENAFVQWSWAQAI